MNIFSKLPGLISDHQNDAVDSTLTEEEAKKERIAFHRAKVRNGPIDYKYPTNGQLRRLEERRRERKAKVARRRQVRAFFKSEREAAVLRGHLQAAGVLPYSSSKVKRDPLTITNSVEWLIQRFSTRTGLLSEKEITDALTAALNRWQHLTNQALTSLDGAAL